MGTARANYGRGFVDTLLPVAIYHKIGIWHAFLHVNDLKGELFCLLSRQVIESIGVLGQQLVAIDGQQILQITP